MPVLDRAAFSGRIRVLVHVFVPPHAPEDEQYRYQQLYQQPYGNVNALGVLEQIFAVLNAEQSFGHHNAPVNPALGAHPLASGVRDVTVVLAHRGGYDNSDQNQPARHERVRSGHLEDVLEEKRVQLGRLPKYHQLAQRQYAHVRAFGIEPPDGRPALRRELHHGSFNFPRCCVYVPDARPFVLPHFQHLTDAQPAPYPEPVAD